MSEALEWVERARRSGDAAEAERFALTALVLEPDLGAVYALRGRLAVARGDALAAAFQYRVAYARGDRSEETRATLAVCLHRVGQTDLAERVREGASHEVDGDLEAFGSLVEQLSTPIRQVLTAPLPPRGAPALMPGERLPAQGSPPAQGVKVTRTPGAAHSTTDAPRSASAAERPSGAPATSAGHAAAPPAVAPPPPAAAARAAAAPVRGRRLPEWVELVERAPMREVEVGSDREEWVASGVEQVRPLQVSDGLAVDLADDAAPLEVTRDPGLPSSPFRSPITGRVIRPEEIQHQRAQGRMPEVERGPDLLAQRERFLELIPRNEVLFALELPGPVMTAVGATPRPLCRLMYFGGSDHELVFLDAERPDVAPVRLPTSQVTRMDVVNDDQQVSFVLMDQRQLHLDLRGLARLHAPSVRQLVQRLERIWDSDGV
jgi:hypothetical protein